MESPVRKTTSDVNKDFFRLMLTLEESQQLKDIELIPSRKLGFPASDVLAAESNKLELGFMGLVGVDSPLPHYFHAYANDILYDFLKLFNHKIYQLFYEALKKYQPIANDKNYVNYLSALSGQCLTTDDKKLFSSVGLLGKRVKSRVGLKALLRRYMKNIDIAITPFIPTWVTLLPEKEIRLGENSLLGEKLIDFNAKIRIEIGLLSLKKFLYYRHDDYLFNIISRYCGVNIKVEICFLVKESQPFFSYGRLGLTSWMGCHVTDDIIRFRIIID